MQGLKSALGIAAVTAALAAPLPAAAAVERVYIGTSTNTNTNPKRPANGHGEGIYLADFDPATGKLGTPVVVAKTPSPSWIILNKAHTVLYAANSYGGFTDPKTGQANVGSVSAFAVDKASGKLTLIDTVSVGDVSCHIALDPTEKYMLSANYDGGSITVLPIRADGGVGAYTDLVRPQGPIHPDTAADNPVGNHGFSDHSHSHIHMVGFDPSGKYAIVNDAGLDNVLVFRSTLDNGKLVPVTTYREVPGSAPRHYAFSPDGKTFYDLLEQDSKLAVYGFDPATGTITPRQKLSALPPNFAGSNLASELLITKDGRHLYSANRLNDTIASYAVGTGGVVTSLGQVPTNSDYPRSLALDPTDHYIFSMNQNGESITVFRLNGKGVPVFLNEWVPIGNPMTMAFLDN